jgi:TfoX/Sxy family transcriptional regulator of competence genes
MPYDEDMAHRVRELLAFEEGVDERGMFGGLAFLVDGNMAVAVSGRGALLMRLGQDGAQAAAGRPHVRPAVMRGREMRGWVYVDFAGVRTKRQLQAWVARALAFARTLPAKV